MVVARVARRRLRVRHELPEGTHRGHVLQLRAVHYRYVGTDLAKALVASGLALREFQSVGASRGWHPTRCVSGRRAAPR
jgi:hypothetical protein